MRQAADRSRRAAAGGRAGYPAGSRRGSVMVFVLACMAVASGIGLAMLRSATAVHGSLRTERHLRQVERLLVAAAERVVALEATGEPIAGEILLGPDDIVGMDSARITFAPDPAAPNQIQIVVEYPLAGPVTIRRSRTVSRSVSSTITSEESLP
jgi:hypothetical protein